MSGPNLNDVQGCRTSGVLTTCPVPALQGSLLNSIGSASKTDGSVRQHSKLDSPSWIYHGRSYGAGASIGLTNGTLAPVTTGSISYMEYGYISDVTCSRNTSAAYGFKSNEALEDLGPNYISIFTVKGSLPNSYNDGTASGTGESYSMVSTWSDLRAILAWSTRSIGGENWIAIASGNTNYTEFNQTQCQIRFRPSAFNVTANITSAIITVAPADTTQEILDKNTPNATLTVNAINSVNLLSRMSSSLYTSILGDALLRNLAARSGVDPRTSDISDTTILASLEDSFTAVLDDILGAYGALQVAVCGDTTPQKLYYTGFATRIGSEPYLWLAMAMSAAVLLIQVVEMAQKKLWPGLALFNPFDVKSMMIAVSAGGTDLANQLVQKKKSDSAMTPDSNGSTRIAWLGNDGDGDIGHLSVIFQDVSDKRPTPIIRACHGGSEQESLPLTSSDKEPDVGVSV